MHKITFLVHVPFLKTVVLKSAQHHDVWGVEVELRTFLTSALGGSEWSFSRPCWSTLRERTPVPIG